MNKNVLRNKVLKYASYTVSRHSSEHDDVDKLNEIFETNITVKEAMDYE